MISTVINSQIPKNEKHKIQHRSFRAVDVTALNMEMKHVRLTGNTEDENFNVRAVHDKFETDFRNVFHKHVPIKKDMLNE